MFPDLKKLLRAMNAPGQSAGASSYMPVPRQEWARRNRDELMAYVERTIERPVERERFRWSKLWEVLTIFIPRQSVYLVVRPIMIVFVVFSVAGGGWVASVAAAVNSLPGDAFYSMKLVAERTQIAVTGVTGGTAAEATLRVQFAGNRVDEMVQIVEQPKQDAGEKGKRVAVAAKQLKENIKVVNEQLQTLKESDPARAVEVAKIVDRKSNEFNSALKKSEPQISEATVKDAVKDARATVKEAGINALGVIVDNYTEGKGSVTSGEVKTKLDDKVKTLSEEVTSAEKTATEAFKEKVATSTPEVAAIISVTSTPVKEVTQTAKDTLKEAQAFIEKTDFASAVDKLKEAQVLQSVVTEIADLVVNIPMTNSSTPTSAASSTLGSILDSFTTSTLSRLSSSTPGSIGGVTGASSTLSASVKTTTTTPEQKP